MVARVSSTGFDPVKAREIISHWFVVRHTTAVTFKENTSPARDPDARYEVAYAAIFEPSTLEQARLEIWITTDGHASIGFETQKRIAKRLGIRSGGERFGAGHEPSPITAPALLAVLDMIAEGQISIAPTTLPFLGLISTRAVMVREAKEKLVAMGYSSGQWLREISKAEFFSKKNLLRFHRWT